MLVYLALTLSGRSRRATRVPTSLYCSTGLRGAVPVSFTLNGLSPRSSPYLTERPGSPATDTTPLATVSASTGAFNRAAASRMSAARASAAAARSCGPPRSIDELEVVAPWSGVTWVSSRTALSWPMSRSSSSPAICSMPVVLPWPSSHFPKMMVAVLSACTATQESIWAGIGRSAEVGARGRHPAEAEADDQRAAALEQIAARGGEEIDVAHARAHGVSPAITRDASLIAFMTRG